MVQNLTLVLDLSHSGYAGMLDSAERVLSRRARSVVVRNEDVAAWVEEGLAEAGGDFTSLTRILVGIGPGSFTGIRIAMAFAQGLGFPRSLPLQGFTSLSALLLSKPTSVSGPVVAAIPANSGRFYAAVGLEDPGTLLEAEGLRQMGGQGVTLVVHENSPRVDALQSSFAGLAVVGEKIDFPAIVRNTRLSGRDARHPHYIQSPAAEARLQVP